MPERIIKPITEVIDAVDETVDSVMKESDRIVRPYRRSVFRRFPTLFILLVTFGVSATFFGFERIIISIPVLSAHP
jgi:hypothetical protein